MSFEEVIKLKNEHSEPFILIDQEEYELFIMPEKNEDFELYKKFVEENISELVDEDARLFSTNNQYKLGAISLYRDFIIVKREI